MVDYPSSQEVSRSRSSTRTAVVLYIRPISVDVLLLKTYFVTMAATVQSLGSAPAVAAAADPALVADIAALSSLADDAFASLLTIAGRVPAVASSEELIAEFEAWATGCGLKPKQARGAARTALLLLAGARRACVSASAFREDLLRLGLSAEKCDAASKYWAAAGTDALSAVALAKEPSAAFPLVDADWRFGVTASTDDVSRVGSTFVQLKVSDPATCPPSPVSRAVLFASIDRPCIITRPARHFAYCFAACS